MLYSMDETRHKGPHVVGLHLYETSKMGKSDYCWPGDGEEGNGE